jgi:hypothetical protein
MFLIYFVNAFRSSITANLGAYVVSGFEAHSLIPIIGVVSSVMSAACYMPIAKFLNLFDRSKGFLFMVALGTLGTILSATCTNIQMYCAAEVSTGVEVENGTGRGMLIRSCAYRSYPPSGSPG